MTTYPFRDDLREEAGQITKMVQKDTCKTVWETLGAYGERIRGLGGALPGHSDETVVEIGLACLDKLKDNLIEALPYGPDEVN